MVSNTEVMLELTETRIHDIRVKIKDSLELKMQYQRIAADLDLAVQKYYAEVNLLTDVMKDLRERVSDISE